MRKALSLACLVVGFAAVHAAAVGKGRALEYHGAAAGPVSFDGTAHGSYRCSDCHAGLFPMKKKSVITHAQMDAGQSCGACHDGKTAFGTTANCSTCHKRPPAGRK